MLRTIRMVKYHDRLFIKPRNTTIKVELRMGPYRNICTPSAKLRRATALFDTGKAASWTSAMRGTNQGVTTILERKAIFMHSCGPIARLERANPKRSLSDRKRTENKAAQALKQIN